MTTTKQPKQILAATARIAFPATVSPTLLTPQHPRCISRLSSTAIGDYLCSIRFPPAQWLLRLRRSGRALIAAPDRRLLQIIMTT